MSKNTKKDAKTDAAEAPKAEATTETPEAEVKAEATTETPQTEAEKVAAAKAAAKEKAPAGAKVSPATLKFRKDSGSERVFKVLKAAKAPVGVDTIIERVKKAGLEKNPDGRSKAVLKWFVSNKVAVQNGDSKYMLAETYKAVKVS